jgi:hypothetical protein
MIDVLIVTPHFRGGAKPPCASAHASVTRIELHRNPGSASPLASFHSTRAIGSPPLKPKGSIKLDIDPDPQSFL